MKEIVNPLYSLTGIWHWERVEVHTEKNGWEITREYRPGECSWVFSDDGNLSYRRSSEPIPDSKYEYRPYEMLHIYRGHVRSGEWWPVEWLTLDNIMLYPADGNEPLICRVKLRRADEGRV